MPSRTTRRRGRPPKATVAKTTRRRSTNGRRRRQQSGLTRTVALLSSVTSLVRDNEFLSRENNRLRSMIDEVGKAIQRLTAPAPTTRGRRKATATADGRPRKRRRITDPAVLERRRAGLAKARQVLAAKRAAAKRAAAKAG
jgi:hypothetical protein